MHVAIVVAHTNLANLDRAVWTNVEFNSDAPAAKGDAGLAKRAADTADHDRNAAGDAIVSVVFTPLECLAAAVVVSPVFVAQGMATGLSG